MAIENNKLNISNLKFKRGTSEQLNSSSYVPLAGEIVVATDATFIKVGNGTKTLAELSPIGGAVFIEDSYDSTSTNTGLSAAKGKDLNERIEALRNVFNTIDTLDCGELPEETEDPEQQSGE